MSNAASAELANPISDQTLSADGRPPHDIINACFDMHHLDEAAKLLWKGYGEGSLSDDEATYLSNLIERRRPLGRRTAPGHATQLGRVNGRVLSRFAPASASALPIARRRAIADGGSAVPARCLTICGITKPRASARCCVSSPLRLCSRPICRLAYGTLPPL
jgi:hypothetical protein